MTKLIAFLLLFSTTCFAGDISWIQTGVTPGNELVIYTDDCGKEHKLVIKKGENGKVTPWFEMITELTEAAGC